MSDQIDGEPITAEGLQALKDELADLEGPRMQDLAKLINAARMEGDLSENAEYHALKDEQGLVQTKILRLKERLRNAVVVEVKAAGDVVTFGVPVTVKDEGGRSVTWTIVGPTEADIKSGKLSAESPVAQALLNTKVGQTVAVKTPKGDRPYTVESVG